MDHAAADKNTFESHQEIRKRVSQSNKHHKYNVRALTYHRHESVNLEPYTWKR